MSARHWFGAFALLMGCVGQVGESELLSTGPQTQTIPGPDAGVNPDAGAPKDTTGTASPAPSTASSCPGGGRRALASGLRIREISLYQTIKVPLYQNNTWVSPRPILVVQGKRSLVRVFADTITGYRPHAVRGVLAVQNGSAVTELVSERSLTAASTDQDASSTFTFDVPAAQIGPSTQISVTLEEAACGSTSTAVARDVRAPASGLQALGATPTGKLKVVIVPVNVGGRVPPTTEKELKGIRDMLLAYYPVPEVEVTVRRPLSWATSVPASDQRAWSNVLNAVMRERGTDRPSSDTYYFGLMQPAPTFPGYCARGCILGIAPQTTRVQASAQVGLGVYFGDSAAAINQSGETVVHELGHAHGRGHAPCAQGGSIAGVDTRFPVAGGNTGVWGWDSRNGSLYPPTHKDVMGYCRPNWISAYTYTALAVRSQAVNTRALLQGPNASLRWHNLIAYEDGTTRWGGNTEVGPPGGDVEAAKVLDAAGNVVAEIEVVRMQLSHSTDQFFYIPEPGKDWATIALTDRRIALTDVAAPL